MEPLDMDELFFFDAHQAALPLYEAFRQALDAALPDIHRKVQKTQITFSGRHVFACVSFLRVKKGTTAQKPLFVLTLGLSHPLDSPRAAAQTEPWPGRWTVHIPLCTAGEIDGELLSWLRQAYEFSEQKSKSGPSKKK